jgi:hypothetical protein
MFFLSLYLYLFQAYTLIRKFLFGLMGPIYLVYKFNGNTFTNITIFYYWTILLNMIGFKTNPSGLFYTKIIYDSETYEIIYQGDLLSINKNLFLKLSNPTEDKPKRKNIMLMNSTKEVIPCDLNRFDQYHLNTTKTDLICITNLVMIGKAFGLEYEYVQIMQMMPFKKEFLEVSKTDITQLYS